MKVVPILLPFTNMIVFLAGLTGVLEEGTHGTTKLE